MLARAFARASVYAVATLSLMLVYGVCMAFGASNAFPPRLDEDARAEIARWAADAMASRYVDVEVGERMAANLRSQAAAGAYNDDSDSAAFLDAIEEDLLSISDDKHVALWFEKPEDAKAEDTDYTPADVDYVAELRRTNFGYKKIEILPGNVGYLRIDEFAHSALGGPATVAVMNTLGNTDALIIDLRWNGGGAGMVPLICGYFFDEPTRLNDTWIRSSGETWQSWTPEYVPGPTLSSIPLFILTSDRTFSAAEDFTYALKHLGRATIVGARTRGGGHPIEIVRLSRSDVVVAAAVPNAKSINPLTGTSWEGVGVAPDIDVLASEALKTAYDRALGDLLEQAEDDAQRLRIEWARSGSHARFSSAAPTRQQLDEYAGTYGARVFVLRDDGVLLYRRDERSSYPMETIAQDLFQLEGYEGYRYQFARDEHGTVDRVISLTAEGGHREYPRGVPAVP